jgi:hypothetical protein
LIASTISSAASNSSWARAERKDRA